MAFHGEESGSTGTVQLALPGGAAASAACTTRAAPAASPLATSETARSSVSSMPVDASAGLVRTAAARSSCAGQQPFRR